MVADVETTVSLVDVTTDVDVILSFGSFFYLASAVTETVVSLADATTDVDVTIAAANFTNATFILPIRKKLLIEVLWGLFYI